MCFEDATQLRCVVETTATVTTRACFRVAKASDGRYYLMVDARDMNETTVISARLLLENPTVRDDVSFCVNCKIIGRILGDSPSCQHLALTMEGYTSKAKVVLRMDDPDQKSHKKVFDLPTYVDIDDDRVLQSLQFEYMIEFDINKLKEMVKLARSAHTDYLRVRIFVTGRAEKRVSIVDLSIQGADVTGGEQFCHEVTRDEDGSHTVVRAAADGEAQLFDMESATPDFDGSFPVEKIDLFLKSVRISTILVAKVGNDDHGQALPIVFEYKLRGASDNGSHIRYLVAAVNDPDGPP